MLSVNGARKLSASLTFNDLVDGRGSFSQQAGFISAVFEALQYNFQRVATEVDTLH